MQRMCTCNEAHMTQEQPTAAAGRAQQLACTPCEGGSQAMGGGNATPASSSACATLARPCCLHRLSVPQAPRNQARLRRVCMHAGTNGCMHACWQLVLHYRMQNAINPPPLMSQRMRTTPSDAVLPCHMLLTSACTHYPRSKPGLHCG
jgi:hypothetical protein